MLSLVTVTLTVASFSTNCGGSAARETYGVNLQALADERVNLLWLSAGLPGATHDLTTARSHDIGGPPGRHQITLFADKGYIGAGPA